ncbi:hypothetical protein ACWCPQ_04120 [Nocardia sp. NPDC001965]
MESGWTGTLTVLAAVGLFAFLCIGYVNYTVNRDGVGAHVSCPDDGRTCTVRFSRTVERPTALVQGTEVRLKSVAEPDFIEIEAARLWGWLPTTTTRVPLDDRIAFGGLGAPYLIEIVDLTVGDITVEVTMANADVAA